MSTFPTPLEAARLRVVVAENELLTARTALLETEAATSLPRYEKPATYAPLTHELSLTSRQLDELCEALEFYQRWLMGHFSVLPDKLEWRKVPTVHPNSHWPMRRAGELALDWPERDRMKALLDQLRALFFPEFTNPGEHYGIGWNERPEQQAMQICYEVQRSIKEHRTRVMHQADPSFMGNTYSGAGLHYSDQARPMLRPLDPKAELAQCRAFVADMKKMYPVKSEGF